MNTPSLPTLALLLTAAAMPAQCLVTTVATQSIGPSCNVGSTGFCAIVALPTSMTLSLDTAACQLGIEVNIFQGCGASVPIRVLALGLQPAAVPLPEFGFGCALHVDPAVLLATTAGPFTLTLPAGVAAFSFYAQVAALSVPPFSSQSVLTFSEGLHVNLQ